MVERGREGEEVCVCVWYRSHVSTHNNLCIVLIRRSQQRCLYPHIPYLQCPDAPVATAATMATMAPSNHRKEWLRLPENAAIAKELAGVYDAAVDAKYHDGPPSFVVNLRKLIGDLSGKGGITAALVKQHCGVDTDGLALDDFGLHIKAIHKLIENLRTGTMQPDNGFEEVWDTHPPASSGGDIAMTTAAPHARKRGPTVDADGNVHTKGSKKAKRAVLGGEPLRHHLDARRPVARFTGTQHEATRREAPHAAHQRMRDAGQ